MPFAQLVIGPPGSGKSTYCDGMHQFMSAIGRKCSVVNLDPANDHTSYPCALDVRDLVTLDEIMEEEELGPNGGVLYALEELENNFEWLEQGLKKLEAIHLTDSHALTLPSLYISTLLLSLRSMLQLSLPHLNVLTKIDNLATYPPLPFNLDFYTEPQDLTYLLPHLEAESPHLSTKFGALNAAIVELVQDFNLVGFETLAVEDKTSMMHLLRSIDRAGGYAFGSAEGANDTVWQVAMREGIGEMDVRDVQERWIDRRDEFDEAERKAWEEEAERIKRDAERESASSTRVDGSRGNENDDDDDDDEGGKRPPRGVSMPMSNSGVKVVRKS
ncbi:MAG: hypothetical protein M1819_001429 [Sarea resinae]|nr:MAG: hypothetical protein M1819_001429 [Sarea resinae]